MPRAGVRQQTAPGARPPQEPGRRTRNWLSQPLTPSSVPPPCHSADVGGTIAARPLHVVGCGMDPKEAQLRARRKLLQDPYAHIEQLEEAQLMRLHENPYRYAASDISAPNKQRPRSLSDIEGIVTRLQRELWMKRVELGLAADADPVEVLQPEYAARLLGYSYAREPSLGWIAQGPNQIIVAGLFDPEKRTIRVGSDIEPRVARFTGAHEVGHAVLHPYITGLHRDRPLTGAVDARDRVEYEADKFATFFLMPAKLVAEQFYARFLGQFTLNEETAYALMGASYSAARNLLPTLRHMSRALADAAQYNGRHFMSLSEYFGVSTEALAIRLEELNLVAGE